MNQTRNLRLLSALLVTFSLLLTALGQDGISLGELARRERERKRNSAKTARLLTLDDLTLNCVDDWDCLLAAVNRKEDARVQFTETLDLDGSDGTLRSSEIHVEVRDFTEETVLMKAWQTNSRLRFSNRAKAVALARGTHYEDIEVQERAAERDLQRRDGHIIACVFRFERMKEFIRLTKISRENDGAWRLAERCEGLDDPRPSAQASPQDSPEGASETFGQSASQPPEENVVPTER